MEKRRKMLLIAAVLGIGFLFFWGWATYNVLTIPSLIERSLREMYEHRNPDFADFASMSYEDFLKWNEERGGLSPQLDRFWWWRLTLFIICIPAIVLNIFGWLKNGANKILIGAVLYLLSLNLPSAVLCFISFASIRKQN